MRPRGFDRTVERNSAGAAWSRKLHDECHWNRTAAGPFAHRIPVNNNVHPFKNVLVCTISGRPITYYYCWWSYFSGGEGEYLLAYKSLCAGHSARGSYHILNTRINFNRSCRIYATCMYTPFTVLENQRIHRPYYSAPGSLLVIVIAQ